MPIVVDCPGCLKRYEVDSSLAGKKSRCQQCGEVFRLPTPNAVEAVKPPSSASSPRRSPQETFRENNASAAGGSANRPPSVGKPISVNCPSCGKQYAVDAALGGKKSRCKQCNEVFTIPVPMGIITELPSKPARPTAPPPPKPQPAMELLFDDDEPDTFKRAPSKPAPVYEDEELPPPRRIAYSTPSQKSKRDRSMDPQLGITVTGWFLALNALAFLGIWIARSVVDPIPRMMVGGVGLYMIFVGIVSLLLAAWGGIWLLVIAFQESTSQGLLCLLVPCYQLYYVISRWEDARGAVCLSVGSQIPAVVLGIVIPLLFRGTILGETNSERSKLADQIAPNFGPAPGQFEGPPVLPGPFGPGRGPMPGPGGFPGGPPPQPGMSPFPGRPNIRVETIDQRLQRLVEVYGDRAVSIVVTGLPKNTIPDNGVTNRDVFDAINKQLRELEPGAKEFTSFGLGDRSRILMAPVDDKPGLARRIGFGKAVVVKPDLIEVTVFPDFIATVPRLPAEQPVAAANPRARRQGPEPVIPADADPVTKSLLQLKSTDDGKRKDAVKRLERLLPDEHVDEVVKALLPLLDDDDGFFVTDVIKALIVWQNPKVVPALIQRSKDNRFGVRHAAIKALGQSKDVRAVEPLIERFEEDGHQSENALKELGAIAEPALIARLKDGEPKIRRKACDILKVIGGRDTLKAMDKLPSDPDLLTRAAAAEAYKQIVARVGRLPSSTKSSKSGSGSRVPK
jgi:predicted Zn finger-like uncharacterized protein